MTVYDMGPPGSIDDLSSEMAAETSDESGCFDESPDAT